MLVNLGITEGYVEDAGTGATKARVKGLTHGTAT